MGKINYHQARNLLKQACNQYIAYNKAQLDSLLAQSFCIPSESFFEAALRKEEPTPGFNDWVTCEYYYALENLLFGNWEHCGIYDIDDYMEIAGDAGEQEQKLDDRYGRCDSAKKRLDSYKKRYKGLIFLRGFDRDRKNVNQSDHHIVLHN